MALLTSATVAAFAAATTVVLATQIDLDEGMLAGLGSLAALIGGSLAFFASLGAPGRVWFGIAVTAGLVDLAVLAYWIYFVFDALQGAR